MAFTLETSEQQANYARNTQGLKPGYYVTGNGFFWHPIDVLTVAGPFTTQDDAMECRRAVEFEMFNGNGSLWVDEVAAPAILDGTEQQ